MLRYLKSILVLIVALTIISGSCVCVNAVEPVDRIVFHVSTTGNDDNPGTEAAPFATIERAAKVVKQIDHTGIPVDVLIHGGKYRIDNIVDFCDPSSGGSENAKVTYKAAGDGEVIFSGFKDVDVSKFTKVTDPEFIDRFEEAALPNIGALDLQAQGFERDSLDMFLNQSKDNPIPDTLEYLILRLNGKEQWLAQWPNYGEFDTIMEVVNSGPTSARTGLPGAVIKYTDSTFDTWKDVSTSIVRGYLSNVYLEQWNQIESVDTVNKTVTLKYYSASPGVKPGRTWRVLNIAEELDAPGEFFVDLDTMTLYFYPPYKMSKTDKMELSVTKDVWFNVKETQHIVFDGLQFEGFRITKDPRGLISIYDSNFIEVRNCRFQYDGGGACVEIRGKNNTVEANGFYNCGAVGVFMNNDGKDLERDFPNLEHENNRVINNHFYNTGNENIQGSGFAVTTGITSWYAADASVGNIINNNLIHHIYGGMNILYGNGDEWDISYNEIANGLRILADYGLIYAGARSDALGTTVNYNYCHDYVSAIDPSYACNAIYFDDWLSGQVAENNICIAGDDGATNGIFNVGAYTTVRNNISATGRTGVMAGDRGTKIQDKATAKSVATGLADLPAPLAAKYPHMAEVYTKTLELDGLFATMGNLYTGNVTVNAKNNFSELSLSMGTFENNYVGEDMSIFVDPDNHDWRVKSEVAEELGFDPGVITDKNFDMDQIGIQKDVWDVKNPLDPFKQIYPANGATKISSKDIQLSWEPALFADEYDYVVATDPELKNVVASGTSVFEYANIGDLDLGKSYYWKVTARNITKQIGAEWESEGVPYLFTTTTREEIDKSFLKTNMEIAETKFSGIKDGSGAVGEFKEGTEERFQTLLSEAKYIYHSYVATQDKIDEMAKTLDSAVRGISAFKNMGWRTVDTSDAKKWVPANTATTVAENDGVITLTGGNTVAYTDKVENYEMLKFKYKGDHSNGWTGLTIRQENPSGNVYNGVQYLVVIKQDIFEFQKYQPGASATGILETKPNNGIVNNNEWCDIEFGAADVDGGVQIFFKVNGETVFDFYDADSPIYTDGSFCIKPPAGVAEIAPADEVPEGYYIPDQNISDRGSYKIYTEDSSECVLEGKWKSNNDLTTGYNEKGVRLSESADAKVYYKLSGKREDNKMVYYWHEPIADADPEAKLVIKFNWKDDEELVLTRTIDMTSGESGWRALGSFPFNAWGTDGTVELTFTSSGKGLLELPAVRVVEIEEDEKNFAHLFYRNATAMTALKIGKGYAYCDAAKLTTDVAPQIINDKTYLPLRFLADAFGYDVAWDGTSRTATITSNGKTIQVQPGQNQMTIDGQVVELEATALLINDRILLPIRDITEALGKTVLWNGDTQIVLIGDGITIAENDNATFQLIDKQFGGDEHEE